MRITSDMKLARLVDIHVGNQKHTRVFEVDLNTGEILEGYYGIDGPDQPTMLFDGPLPDDGVDRDGLLCRWSKPDNLKVCIDYTHRHILEGADCVAAE